MMLWVIIELEHVVVVTRESFIHATKHFFFLKKKFQWMQSEFMCFNILYQGLTSKLP
jgi:hypothetical protein